MLSWIWICVTETVLWLHAIKVECVLAGALHELLRCSAKAVLSRSRQILWLSCLECYGQIKKKNPTTFLCRLFAIFHIFRHLRSFFLAEPPEWPLSLSKSQLVPLVSLIFCSQPTDHSCCRSVTPPWGQGTVKWLLSPCLVTDEACVWSLRGSHSIYEPEFAEAIFWLGWTWQILKQRIKCKERYKLLLLLSQTQDLNTATVLCKGGAC